MTAQTKTPPIIRISIFGILLFQICGLFARSALEIALVMAGKDHDLANDLSYLVVPPILFVLLYPSLRNQWGMLLNLIRPDQLTVRLCCLSILLGITMRITYMAMLTVLMWSGVVRNDDTAAIAGPIIGFTCPPLLTLTLSLIVMAFLVPLVEEVINRGLLLHALLPRGVATSVILSAALFAVMHQPGTWLVAFVGGILFGIQMLNARTLWAPLLSHAAYNAASTVSWDCMQIVWNPPLEDPRLSSLTQIAAPVAVCGALVCSLLVSKKVIGTR